MIGLTITTHYEGVTDLTEQETHPECVGHHPMGWGRWAHSKYKGESKLSASIHLFLLHDCTDCLSHPVTVNSPHH